jgi:hypothetical protein
MGATYTRQSSYADGDVITAAHTNDEFNQILAAFAASTGHTHDGTAGEGGPITSLLGNTLSFGDGSTDADIVITFNANGNDGELKWMEDEDYFEFSDDILIASTEKLQFRDTAIHISSSTDGQLDLVSDGAVVIDTAGDITLDADGGDIFFKDGGTTFGSATNSSGNLILKSGTTTAVTFDGANTTFAGTVTIGSAEISEAELEILDGATVTTAELNILDGVTATTAELNLMDGVTATTAEINIIDGDTSATSTTVADADRVVLNDNGTMVQVAVTDLAAYFDDEITAMPNLVTTAATTVGALNSGSITSGFGTIDTGSSTITTTGLITGGALDIDDVVINGTTIGHTDDTDLITLASGSVTIAGDLTISGDDLTMGTNTSGHIMVADGTNFNPVAVSGDATISNTGAVTIANNAVETAMLNANVISGQSAETSLDTSNDTLLMFDNSASGLKKITLATLSSGLGGITDVVADTSPQLGGSLDVNGEDIVSVSNGNITLTPNGTGVVRVDGTSGIDMQSGGISIKNSGSESYVRFYCESSNAHYSQLQASPHSAYSGNVTLVLPASADTLVGRATTDTLTNKTLTSPKINEDVAVTATATELNIMDGVTSTTAELNILDGVTSTAAELNILDGVTSTAAELNLVDGSSAGTIANSKAVIYGSSGEVNATTLQVAGTSITSTAAELNLLDGSAKSTSSITVADSDAFIVIDGTTTKQIPASDLKTYAAGSSASKGFATAMAIAL